MHTSCILFQGSVGGEGYGVAWINGRAVGAHRLAWLLAGRTIPRDKGVHLHHICGNKLCINADHLELLTPSDHSLLHARERWAGRQACPKGHPYPESLRRTRNSCAVCEREWARVHRQRQKVEVSP